MQGSGDAAYLLCMLCCLYIHGNVNATDAANALRHLAVIIALLDLFLM
jgi:hypothetical protein